jgi:iron(III) transport system permease protein
MGMGYLFYSIFALILFVCAAPAVTVVYRILSDPSLFSVLWSWETLQSLLFTLKVAFASLALGTAIAIPLSWLLVRTDLKGASFYRRILLFPYLLPPYLFAIAWVTLAVPQVGILNRLVGGNVFNIYSFTGLTWVLATAYFPVILSSLCHTLEAMDPSLEEAGRISGANPLSTFCKITLPCLLPTLAASSLLFLMEVMAAFGIPAMIGNPGRLYVLTTKIYTYAKMGGLKGIDQAFVVSFWLLGATLLFLWLNDKIRNKYQYRLTAGKTPRHSVIKLGLFQWQAGIVTCLLTFCFVVLPLVSVVVSSFLRIAGDLNPNNFTLDNYRYLWDMPELSRAFSNSLFLSVTTTLACLILGFFIAYFKDRSTLRGRHGLQRLATFPFAIPGTIIALAVIVSFGGGWGISSLALLGSPLLILIAYLLKYLALSVQSVTPSLSNIDPSLDEAARISGANRWGVIGRILVPILIPSLGSIALLTLLPVFTELTMSVLLAGPGTETVGTVLFQLQDYANPLAACALATVLIVIFVSLVRVIRKVGGKLR